MRYLGSGSEFFQNLATDQQQHFIYIYFSLGHRAVGQELHREVPEQEVIRSVLKLKINLCILTSIGYYP